MCFEDLLIGKLHAKKSSQSGDLADLWCVDKTPIFRILGIATSRVDQFSKFKMPKWGNERAIKQKC